MYLQSHRFRQRHRPSAGREGAASSSPCPDCGHIGHLHLQETGDGDLALARNRERSGGVVTDLRPRSRAARFGCIGHVDVDCGVGDRDDSLLTLIETAAAPISEDLLTSHHRRTIARRGRAVDWMDLETERRDGLDYVD